jgi:large subunit ribosomal protein L17
MRHRKAGRKLKRTASHRKALLNALATSVFRHKRIRTTTAKAKEAQRFVDRLITRAKRALAAQTNGTGNAIHARREVSRFIKDRAVVKSLFEEIAPKVMERVGGYTRIVKLGQRHGDAAEVSVLELVDFSGAVAASTSTKEEKHPKAKSKEKESAKEKGTSEKQTSGEPKAKKRKAAEQKSENAKVKS